MAAIELRGVGKYFDGNRAVDDLSLSVEPGEILALLGPSGSGKTTALRLIAGFERPDAGRVTIGGQVVADASTGTWVPPEQRRVGMVFQDLALFPHMTVRENVAFGLRGEDRRVREARVAEVIRLVGIGDLLERYPYQLSGGQQQRVAVARAIAVSPRFILLDEPFSSLDPDLRDQVREDVRQILRTAGATAIFVTHDQGEALGLADRVAVLNRGRIEQVDRPLAVYHTPASRFVADFLGLADFLPGDVTGDRIQIEIGTVPNPGLADSARVDVLVRPSDVLLTPDRTGQGVIQSRRFRGSDNYYTVRLGSGRALHSIRPITDLYGPGTAVRVELAPTQLVLFQGERAIAASCLVPGCLCGPPTRGGIPRVTVTVSA